METSPKRSFIQLRAQGIPYSAIAEKLGKSKQTLINWSKELKTDIANYRAIELDALRTQYQATKAVRLRILGQALAKVEQALQDRDMANVSTDKLVAMAIKLSEQLNQESETITFTRNHPFASDDHLDQIEWVG